MARISIFGLGYVGAVSAGCMANDGHDVIGVDKYAPKVDAINAGRSPIIEKDIDEVIATNVQLRRLQATMDSAWAIQETDVSLVCVGTPSQVNGSLDLTYVRQVCREMGLAIKAKSTFHTVVMRSTMLPGTMRDVVIPTLEQYAEKKAGRDFGVCINPEFLREGTAVYDYYHPPKTVIGETDPQAGDVVAQLYGHLDAPLIRTSIETAEMVKYTDNVWHALKVCFANEIGNLSKELNVDGHEVMDIFCHDTKLNLSPYYLKPGFAFGGSCLPKDVRALTYKAKSLDLHLPVLESILASNHQQMRRGMDLVVNGGRRKKIGVLGFAFKAGTDDLRESPMVEVIERLIGKGYDLRLYDKYVNIASLVGANRDYIMKHIPHIYSLMAANMKEVVDHAETLVIGTNDEEFRGMLDTVHADKQIVDLVRIEKERHKAANYQGICW